MKKIWKYQFPVEQDKIVQAVPQGLIPLHVGAQYGDVCLWVEVYDSAPLVRQSWYIIGTGWEVPDKATYLGTAIVGSFVWHLYDGGWKPIDRKKDV